MKGDFLSSQKSNEKKKMKIMQSLIKFLIMVVVLGLLMIWFMMPTSTFNQIWLPSIRATANSKYFGLQGANLLIWTFPVLFIAVLGCIYLHLDNHPHKNQVQSNKTNTRLTFWKRTALVNGPLGIVSWTELSFLVMFIALLVWSFITYIHVSFSKITVESAKKEGLKLWVAKLDSAGLRIGLVGNICLSFLFFPMARGSSVLPLLGLTSEASIKYHIWLGHMVMTLFTSHGLCYIVYFIASDHMYAMLRWSKTGISIVAGEISLVAGLAMWATSYSPIRRKKFNLFFCTHHLYIVFLLFFVFHAGIRYACIMLPGVYLFIIDRYLRFLQSRSRVQLCEARVLPCEVVELNFSKTPGLHYTPTSVVFVNIPSISKLQWHPFTVTSSSFLEEDRLSVVIKSEGNWSKKLYQLLSSTPQIEHLRVSVEGPYGPTSQHFLRHDTLVMVSGGSGITPFISIIRELVVKSQTSKSKTPRILVICAFKYARELKMLDLLFPIRGIPSETSCTRLQIEAYITRETQQTSNDSMQMKTIQFKQDPLEIPISPVLGQNSWLWLAVIISSSFFMFLILLGIITRFYIYPIDKNTNKVYSSTLRSLINMALIFFCIIITSTIVVYWNKKLLGAPREIKRSRSDEYQIELESLPYRSLLQATNVHFGCRPDLKKVLLHCEGSSIGVLTCGPKTMRHDVATICANSGAENLYFESISFNW